MKTVGTITFFLLLTITAVAQPEGFRTEKGKIVWERFFAGNSATMKTLLEGNDKIKITEGAAFTGQGQAVKNEIDANSVRLESDANFDFIVTEVPGGYRVKVTNYTFLEKYGPSQMRIIPGSIEKYYLEYGKIRNTAKTQNDLGYLDGFLSSLFAGQPAEAGHPVVASK